MKRRKRNIVATASGSAILVVALLAGLCWQDLLARAEFVKQFEFLGWNDQGYSEYRHRQTGIVFVRVRAGRFAWAELMTRTLDKVLLVSAPNMRSS